jgi:hypothetical protein
MTKKIILRDNISGAREILYKSMLFMFIVFLFEMFYYMFKQMISVF